MATDPDAEGGPDPTWFRSELDACRSEIARLRAERDAMRPVVVAALNWQVCDRSACEGHNAALRIAADTYREANHQ